MFTSLPASFNEEYQLPILKQQRRHNTTKRNTGSKEKVSKSKLEEFFEGLRNEKNEIEGFENADSDSDSDSEETPVSQPEEQNNNTEYTQPAQRMLAPPQNTQGKSGKDIIGSDYKPRSTHNTTLKSSSNYNDKTYTIDKTKWEMPNYSVESKFMKPTPSQGEDTIIDKLNYAIQLLEEKRYERTEQVTEELILYGLLGVFIIFSIDSFVRVGEYTR